eukprot:m.7970 g.7970  ORF g.7970 m.7970 type:complete len:107 (+) comp5305_c0_seq1:184-504(+)
MGDLYHKTTLGLALQDSLTSLLEQQLITPEQVELVNQQFEKVLEDKIESHRPKVPKAQLTDGKSICFNHMGDLWKVQLKDVVLRVNDEDLTIDRMTLLALESDKAK